MSVIIGSKYVGKAESRNVQTGEFWSVMPEVSGYEYHLQTALLNKCWNLIIRRKAVWKFLK